MRQPGIYEMPHDQYLKEPGVSKSLLDDFRVCPLKAYERMNGLLDDRPTEAMIEGQMVDRLTFDPGADVFHIQPETYPADGELKKWSNNANYCKAWQREHEDMPVVTRAKAAEIGAMVDAVWDNPKAKRLLDGAVFQPCLFAKHPKTGLLRKGKPDGASWVGRYLLDLKRVADASTEALSRSIERNAWYVQAAYYCDLCEALGKDITAFYFIAVETGERPKVNVRRLDLKSIELGRWVYERDLRAFAECHRTGVWPGYDGPGDEVGEVRVPEWTESKVMGQTVTLKIGGKEVAV